MKTWIKTFVISAIAAAVLIGSPAASSAQDKEKGKEKGKASDKGAEKSKGGGFTGKAVAVDKAAKTVKLSGEKGRVLQITASTRITKGGNPATLDDLKEGEEVSGGYKTSADGKMEATSLNIGPRPAKGKKEEKK
ncbi:MAG: hypothetical protein WCS99_11230 [Limisphaerales bacterium]